MFSIKIAGPAGFGIKITGQILAKIFLRLRADVFAYTEYPSLIRGGHNTYQVDIGEGGSHPYPDVKSGEGSRGISDASSVNSPSEKCDILIAFTVKALQKELDNLNEKGVIICESTLKHPSASLRTGKNIKTLKSHYGGSPTGRQKNIINAPLIELAKTSGGELMKNTVALGVLLKILDLPLEKVNEVLEDTFGHKSEIALQNKEAARQGYEWLEKNNFSGLEKYRISAGDGSLSAGGHGAFGGKELDKKNESKIIISGNQASALGAIAAGCQVYAAYPMTPATEIMHYLEAKQRITNMIVHQGEDEIAVIHSALGSSFAGVRSACGTSGGGFALMTEGLSLAGQLELPLVIFEVMRPGPATGLPTWTEQGDLSFVLTAGHGDFPRAVLAPGNPKECFQLTQKAFNIADKFQIPVIVLSDKFLGESAYSVSAETFDKTGLIDRGKHIKKIKGDYLRYKFETDGVSARTLPGVFNGEHFCSSTEHNESGLRCGEYICNSDEHSEAGFSDDTNEIRKKMVDKRQQKLIELQKEIPLPTLYGDKDADITLITWGSMLGPCLDTLKNENIKTLKQNKINILHFNHIWPVPLGLEKFLKKFKKLVLVENNKTAQFGKLIRQETGIEIENKILKYDGRPIWKEEIIREIEKLREK